MNHVIIIGGGISGLAIAYRLSQALPSAGITLLERNTRLGGTIWTERRDGFQVETGPNGFLDTNPSTINLCQEVGLGPQLISASDAAARNRFLFLGGKLQPLPGGLGAFLRSDLLSWRGKLRLLTEPFRPRRRDTADESIDAFARRRAGHEAADTFADALVTGIHAGDPTLLSAKAAFPRLVGFEEESGSVVRGLVYYARQRRTEAKASGQPYQRSGRMWSCRAGLRILVETLEARLTHRRPPPADCRLPAADCSLPTAQVAPSFPGSSLGTRAVLRGINVQRIEKETSREDGRPAWTIRGAGQEHWAADAVVLACPAHQQAAILAELDRELAEKIGGIAYNRIAVVALAFRQADVHMSLEGFGYIAPQRTRRDVLGVQWCSSIFPDRAPSGAVLLTAMCGGWHRAEMVGWDDDRLLQAVLAELRLAMGISAEPIFHHIVRWDPAIPQYLLGHLDRVAWIEQRLACHTGLFLAGNAYHGGALNDCVERAAAVAQQVATFLS